MFVVIGVICLFSKLDCTTVGMIGHPYDTKDTCMKVVDTLDKAIKPVEWLYGQFECKEDEQI